MLDMNREILTKLDFHERGDMKMPIKYEDPVTGEYFDTESEADSSGMLHREMYFNDDGGAAARARQEMEEELMEQERQRNIERERAWKQYQAQLREQEERKRWQGLSHEQQLKEIIDNAMDSVMYHPTSKITRILIYAVYATIFVFSIYMFIENKFGFTSLVWGVVIFFPCTILMSTIYDDWQRELKSYDDLLEEMKETARKTKSKALTIQLEEPLDLKNNSLKYRIYFAAKYGFEVTNPEFQELYKKTRKLLVRDCDTKDLDWESLWSEKPKETAA